jgi:hypothetical protein
MAHIQKSPRPLLLTGVESSFLSLFSPPAELFEGLVILTIYNVIARKFICHFSFVDDDDIRVGCSGRAI